MPNRFGGILFDLGNTLVHFEGSWPETFAEADQAVLDYLRSAGVGLDEEKFIGEFRGRLNQYYVEREAEFIEHTTAYILRSSLADFGYPDLPEEVLKTTLKKMYAVSQSHWVAEDDALQTLETLRSRSYRLAVVSNAGDDADVQTLVDNRKFRPYLDFVSAARQTPLIAAGG